MIVTNENQGWLEKINFTDKNDVFVGYDMSQDCCENFGWYATNSITKDTECEGISNFEGYVFDTTFFEEIEEGEYDVEAYVVFKLTKEGEDDIYLHLYNHHNGYYSHGFKAKVGGEIWKEGSL